MVHLFLEHQPELEKPLKALLRAARSLVVINWYRPPEAEKKQNFNTNINIWYATWPQDKVLDIISQFGTCEIQTVEGSTNVLYVVRIRPSKTAL